MRLNIRKLTIAGAVAVVFWLIVMYSSVIDVPGSLSTKNTVEEMQKRIDKLQKLMDDQMTESSNLLMKVQKHLKSQAQKEEKVDDRNDVEYSMSKYC